MPHMVRVTLQNGERPIQLLQQHHPRKFMSQRHFAEREHEIGLATQLHGKTVRWADRENQRDWVAVLMIAEKSSKLFRRQLLAA